MVSFVLVCTSDDPDAAQRLRLFLLMRAYSPMALSRRTDGARVGAPEMAPTSTNS